jgi:hypothetical protein
LVLPVIKSSAGAASSGDQSRSGGNGDGHQDKQGGGGDGGGSGIDCDPAILGLIKRLPQPDSDFPLEKQARWLLAVSHAFAVVYPAKDDDGRSLKIEIVKD